MRYSKYSKKFALERSRVTVVDETHICSEDKTSMSEIVKRFNMNEVIPNSQLEMNYQYDDNSISFSTDEKGGEDTINFESLNLVPMTENLDNVEIPEFERIGDEMYDAMDRARSYMRGKQAELKANRNAQEKAEYDRLKKTFDNGVTETQVSAPTPNVNKSTDEVKKV